jgi:hypothetical protein
LTNIKYKKEEKMGKAITISVAGSSYCWIALGIGIISAIALFLAAYFRHVEDEDSPRKKTLLVWLAVTLMIFGAGAVVYRYYDAPKANSNYEAAMEKLEEIQRAYQHPFFIKEKGGCEGIWGEVQEAGGFIFWRGKIYGTIDSGDSGKIVTVIYEDNDPVIDPYIGVHRSVSFQLEHVLIETIPAGERPFLSFPDARINHSMDRLTLFPGDPHLYLPEGWEIL